jgi:hypothetical protein
MRLHEILSHQTAAAGAKHALRPAGEIRLAEDCILQIRELTKEFAGFSAVCDFNLKVSRAGACARNVVTGRDSPSGHFAMITLALSQLLFFIYLQTPFTHGEDGIEAFRRAGCSVSSTRRCSCSASCWSTGRIHPPFGEVLKSICENEPRAISLGYKTNQYKSSWPSFCPAVWPA